MKFQSIALAGLIAVAGLSSIGEAAAQAKAAQPKVQSVADIYKNKDALNGKTIRAQGKVVKANNGIRGYNFVHIQDGSGNPAANNHNLIVRSKQTANVGDQVVISGIANTNRDMGAGYFYPLLIDEGTITPKK